MPEIARIPWRGNNAGRWRLLLDEPRDGSTNMAIDEVLALACARGWSPPSLRLYRWAVPTISLGYNQPMRGEVNLDLCVQRGIPMVRRPTGGRALLHHHELTYSLAVPIPYGNRGVLQDYRWISHCFLLALKRLGVVAALSRGTRITEEAGGVCFLSSSRYELTVNGRKVLGSAQRRFSGALLQHGSLLIDIDHSAWTTLFPKARALRARATALKSLLGRSPHWEELVRAVRWGFEEGAKVYLEPGGLTLREQSLVEGLVANRYGTAEWTSRR
ncbi:MAG: biotin/lipoate A/B protein ligase family protein [Candidatus Methylomirabilales bacterium]